MSDMDKDFKATSVEPPDGCMFEPPIPPQGYRLTPEPTPTIEAFNELMRGRVFLGAEGLDEHYGKYDIEIVVSGGKLVIGPVPFSDGSLGLKLDFYKGI